MITWVVYLGIGLVIGIASGIFLSRLDMLKSKKQQQLEDDLERTRSELENYRTDVARHFVQTSALINNMTESYRAVFDHLSGGARELCGDRLATHLLDLPKKRMLEQEEQQQQARAAEDVSVSREAISDIEAAPDIEEAEAPAAETVTMEAAEAAEPVVAPEPTAEAAPLEEQQAEKKKPASKVTGKRTHNSDDTGEDDEHAAFAGEAGIPAEMAAVVGTDEAAAAPATDDKQPTVH